LEIATMKKQDINLETSMTDLIVSASYKGAYDATVEYYSQKESIDSKEPHTTVHEAAKRLKVSTLTVRNYIKRGIILAHKVGNRILIDTASIDKALSEVKSLKYKR
jgi:excisionase family DNA binding protein